MQNDPESNEKYVGMTNRLQLGCDSHPVNGRKQKNRMQQLLASCASPSNLPLKFIILHKPQKNIHMLTKRQNQSGEAERSLESFLKESCFVSTGLSPDFPFEKGNLKKSGDNSDRKMVLTT